MTPEHRTPRPLSGSIARTTPVVVLTISLCFTRESGSLAT